MSSFSVGLEIACFLALGVLARKLNYVKSDFAGELSRIVLNFALPCGILLAFMRPLTAEQLHGVPMTLVCAGVYLLAAALASKLLIRNRDEYSAVMIASTYFSNFTFIGYPVIEAFYGAEGILCLSILSIPVRFILYMALPMMFSVKKSGSRPFAWLKVLCVPAVLAIPVGVILGMFNIELPGWLSNAVSSVAATSTPLGMMICGMLVADIKPREIITDRHAVKASFIRLVILPALTLAGLYFLPLNGVSRNVTVMFAAFPAATVITTYAASSGINPKQAATTVTLSTLVSILTLPVWAWILTLV